jgi:hypothetical protein
MNTKKAVVKKQTELTEIRDQYEMLEQMISQKELEIKEQIFALQRVSDDYAIALASGDATETSAKAHRDAKVSIEEKELVIKGLHIKRTRLAQALEEESEVFAGLQRAAAQERFNEFLRDRVAVVAAFENMLTEALILTRGLLPAECWASADSIWDSFFVSVHNLGMLSRNFGVAVPKELESVPDRFNADAPENQKAIAELTGPGKFASQLDWLVTHKLPHDKVIKLAS